jgi:ferredoxin
MVTQEVWGMLLVHHAIRRLMHQAAWTTSSTPTGCRCSAACGSCVVRSPPPARRPSPPEPQATTLARVTAEIAERLLPTRRLRAFPRVVKRKMSNFGVKRAHHRAWPQPTLLPAEAVVILEASKPAPIRRPRHASARRRTLRPSSHTTNSEPAEST